MFRQRVRSGGRPLLTAIGALLLAILIATFTTIWAASVVRREQRDIATAIRQDPQQAGELIERWQVEQTWQLISLAGDFVVLWASAAALVLVWRSLSASQRSLREVTTLAADILASMDQGVVTTDAHSRIRSANPKAVKLLMLRPDYEGHSLSDVPMIGEQLQGLTRRVLDSADSVGDVDLSLDAAQGTLILRVAGSLLRDSESETAGAVLHVRDVTERVLMEEKMVRMERYLELGNLAAGLHHEIRNPLAALSLHVQLIEEGLVGGDPKEIRDSLEVLKTEVTRISGVLESFRDFASHRRLDLQPVSPRQLLHRVFELMRPQAEKQHVKIQLEFDDGSDHPLSLDAMRMQQVLLNLVVNSLDVLPTGGVITLKAAATPKESRIEVRDTGPGIPDNIRQRIFDPYFTTKSAGTGMGLAVCDKIVRQHGGRIRCRADTQGTTFSVVFPRPSTGIDDD